MSAAVNSLTATETHVQRPLGLETKPALGIINLRARKTQVSGDTSNRSARTGSLLNLSKTAVVEGHLVFESLQLLLCRFDRCLVSVDRDQMPVLEFRENPFRITCRAESTIHISPIWLDL